MQSMDGPREYQTKQNKSESENRITLTCEIWNMTQVSVSMKQTDSKTEQICGCLVGQGEKD